MSATDKKVHKKRRWGRVFEYTSYERSLPVSDDYKALLNDLEKEYSKKKTLVVTPQEIATKHDIRVSVAKQLLSNLEEKKILKKAHSNNRLHIYTRV